MAGMLSMLEAVLEIPLEEALEQVPITDEIKLGLLHEEGRYGEALEQVKYFEAAKAYQAKPQYRELYLEAMKEAADLNRAIRSTWM